jgi:hypothetical protein
MPDDSFQFARVRVGGETLWHVHRSGRFLGTIAEVEGSYKALRLIDGLARSRQFPNRYAAARWLDKLTPKD